MSGVQHRLHMLLAQCLGKEAWSTGCVKRESIPHVKSGLDSLAPGVIEFTSLPDRQTAGTQHQDLTSFSGSRIRQHKSCCVCTVSPLKSPAGACN